MVGWSVGQLISRLKERMNLLAREFSGSGEAGDEGDRRGLWRHIILDSSGKSQLDLGSSGMTSSSEAAGLRSSKRSGWLVGGSVNV